MFVAVRFSGLDGVTNVYSILTCRHGLLFLSLKSLAKNHFLWLTLERGIQMVSSLQALVGRVGWASWVGLGWVGLGALISLGSLLYCLVCQVLPTPYMCP